MILYMITDIGAAAPSTAPVPRVLLVDDESSLLRALAKVLELAGNVVVTASEGKQAITLTESSAFDVIVSDIRMPGMDGMALLRAIRATDLDVPVVFLTGKFVPGSEQCVLASRESLNAYECVAFDQAEFVPGGALLANGLWHTGYVFVPQACEAGGPQTCRLAVILHGCLQSAEALGSEFYSRIGANEWADTNDIVVLYPQAHATKPSELSRQDALSLPRSDDLAGRLCHAHQCSGTAAVRARRRRRAFSRHRHP